MPSWMREVRLSAVIQFLGVLRLDPRNLGKHVRIDAAFTEIMASPPRGDKPLDPRKFMSWINDERVFGGPIRMEDPPEGLFTENICFHGGNYVVYPGIQEAAPYIFEQLLATIHLNKSDYSAAFVRDINSTAHFLLTLSDRIAQKMGHKRWICYPESWVSRSAVLNSEQLSRMADAVKFPVAEINAIAQHCGLSNSILAYLTIGSSYLGKRYSVLEHPIFGKPLIKIDTEDFYVVPDPSALLSAMRHLLISFSKDAGILPQFMQNYREHLREVSRRYLWMLRFKKLELSYPNEKNLFPVDYYRFDSDKACCAILMGDTGEGYSVNEVFGMYDGRASAKAVEADFPSIVAHLKKNYPEINEVLILVVLHGIGRSSGFGFNNIPPQTRFAAIPVDDLETLAFQRDEKIDAFTIWNFLIAKDEFRDNGGKFMETSFMSGFSLFMNYHESFYVDDENRPNAIMPPTDGAREYREKTHVQNDFHLLPLPGNTTLTKVVRLSGGDESIPIYAPVESMGSDVTMAVDAYVRPFWVCPTSTESKKDRSAAYYMCDAIAYWLWQLSSRISLYVNTISQKPLILEFEESSGEEATEDFHWEYDSFARYFKLILPLNFFESNGEQSNAPERNMLSAILRMLNHALATEGQPQMDDQFMTETLELVAPLGLKKKLHAFSTTDHPAIFPGNLKRFRPFRSFFLERHLEGVGSMLSQKMANLPENGRIPNDRRKEAFELIKSRNEELLKERLATLDKSLLLKELIEQLESVTKEKTIARATNVTSIACYSTVQKKVEELSKSIPEMNSLSISIRFLIEYAIGTKMDGNLSISRSMYDDLIAASYQYVNWGQLGDHVRCKIFDHELEILKVGRIAIRDRAFQGTMENYMHTKTLEGLEHEINSSAFKTQLNHKNDDFKAAFLEEFKIDLSIVADAVQVLTSHCFERSIDVFDEDYSIFEKILTDAGITPVQVNLMLSVLGLEERDRWSNLPKGFSAVDIEPWKFERKLSVLHRPILKLRNGRVMFGPRHLITSYSHWGNSLVRGAIRKEYFSSDAMKRYCAEIAEISGGQFEEFMEKNLEPLLGLRVEAGLKIGPGEAFESTEDLGDLDIVLIDDKKKKIYLCECKHLAPGRTPTEMSGEINRLVVDRPGHLARMTVHSARAKWVQDNFQIFLQKLGLTEGNWEILSCFITSEEIPAGLLRELPTPILSLARIYRQKMEAFNSLKN